MIRMQRTVNIVGKKRGEISEEEQKQKVQKIRYCKYCGKRMEAKCECDCKEAQKAFQGETIEKESRSHKKSCERKNSQKAVAVGCAFLTVLSIGLGWLAAYKKTETDKKDLNELHEKLESAYTELEQKESTFEIIYAELESEKTNLESEKIKLESEKTELQEQNAIGETERIELELQLSDLESEKIELQEQIENFESEKKNMQAEIEKMRNLTVESETEVIDETGKIDISNYLGHSFAEIAEEIPNLEKISVQGTIKYQNSALVTTGTDESNIVRIRLDDTSDYSADGICCGMSETEAEEILYKRNWEFMGNSELEWKLYSKNSKRIAIKIELGVITQIYVALEGYFPFNAS